MAYVSTQKISTVTIGERIAAYATGFGKKVGDYRLYRRTLNELQGMSLRDLADMGLHPTELHRIAREAVYGAQN